MCNSNSQAESSNKAIVENLKKKLDEKKGLWPDEMKNIMWAYRTTKRTTTGESPFALVYGMEAVLPTEFSHPTTRKSLVNSGRNEEMLLLDRSS